jgi:hypothetical protein
MADFCKEHSIEIWGKDYRDLAGITAPEDTAAGNYAHVICESCGHVLVDHEGVTVHTFDTPTHNSLERFRNRTHPED